MLKRSCTFCHCTEENACPGGCYWVLPNVCSACAANQLRDAGIAQHWIQLPRQALAGLLSSACVAERLVDSLMQSIDANPAANRFTAEFVTLTSQASAVLTNTLNLYDDTAAAGYVPDRDQFLQQVIVEQEQREEFPTRPLTEIVIASEADAADMGIQIGRPR